MPPERMPAHSSSPDGPSSLHDWTFLLGPGIIPGVNALLLGTVLYRTRLVPRIIPTVGLIGAPMLLASATAMLFGVYVQVWSWGMITALPIVVWELSLGAWLVVKGFRHSPITSTGVAAPVRPVENDLVAVIP